jgi:hypothetical protein
MAGMLDAGRCGVLGGSKVVRLRIRRTVEPASAQNYGRRWMDEVCGRTRLEIKEEREQ